MALVKKINTTLGLTTVSVTKALVAAGDYAAEDVLSESASAGTPWVFNGIVPANGKTSYIVKAQAILETTALALKLTLFLFKATPTSNLNDNVANTALLHADLARYYSRTWVIWVVIQNLLLLSQR